MSVTTAYIWKLSYLCPQNWSERSGVIMRGGAICIIALFVVISLFAGHTGAKEGYSIETDVDGTSWGVDRSTQTLNFSMESDVSGSGNFSRNNCIKGISGLSFSEKSSAVRGGNVSLEDDMQLVAREGPVLIKYDLESILVGDEEHASSKIVIDERWATYFKRYNNITYNGRGIRTSERYDDNGELTSTYSDSWKLSKESGYFSFRNRTVILTGVVPGSVNVDRCSNKSSVYFLDLSSIGSLTRIDLMSARPNDEKVLGLTHLTNMYIY